MLIIWTFLCELPEILTLVSTCSCFKPVVAYLYSWYMVSDLVDDDSTVRVNRKQELVVQKEQAGGNAMIGICYLLEAEAAVVRERLEELGRDSRYDGAFWEETLYRKDRMIVTARVVHAADAVEINTYEQLREIDSDSSQLQTDAIQVICEALGAQQDEVTNITVLKKGMTNRSFLFSCKDKKYIMRIPGEGTDQLINRRQEAAVYGIGGRLIDLLAVFALLAGTATTFSVATPLMAEIIGELFHMEVSRTVINIIILLITCCVYTYSLLHGFKGISILAKVCIYLFFGLLAFVLLFGGETRYIIETGFSSLGKMIQNFIGLSTYTDPMRTTNFPQNWTIYYWAYWMVWCVAAPFFIGSISRGRTVRQTILGGYGFGVGSTLVSFIILGNYSMGKQISGAIDFISQYNENGDLYHLIVSMIKTMPCAPLIMVVVLVTMVAFYATSFDSIALTASCYSYRKLEDGEEPAKGIQLMWCILLILLPIALLFAESSMNSLQSVSIVAAFPIGIVIVMIAVSFLKDAKLYLEELQGGKAHGEEKKENR